MKLVIYTQYRENYGAHSWDGEGECPQYWKNKGGSTYVVAGIEPDPEAIAKFVPKAVKHFNCEYKNNYAEEYVLDWYVADDTHQTDEEEWQLGTYGTIQYPIKTINFNEVI